MTGPFDLVLTGVTVQSPTDAAMSSTSVTAWTAPWTWPSATAGWRRRDEPRHRMHQTVPSIPDDPCYRKGYDPLEVLADFRGPLLCSIGEDAGRPRGSSARQLRLESVADPSLWPRSTTVAGYHQNAYWPAL